MKIILDSKQDEALSATISEEHSLRVSLPKYRCLVQATKNRWIGKTLLNVFSSEYPSKPILYYEHAIHQNRLRWIKHGKSVPPGKRVKLSPSKFISPENAHECLEGNENIEHECLVTEAVVPFQSARIIQKTEEIFFIGKPAGIPIYPQGAFSSNALSNHITRLTGETRLFPLSRLDRVTSGLVAFARQSSLCDKLKTQCQKFYLLKINKPWNQVFEKARTAADSSIICIEADEFGHECLIVSKGIGSAPHRLGEHLKVCLTDSGKPAISIFVPTLERSDIIIGIPITGRTHQLRVHAAFLEAWIPGDPLYDPAKISTSSEHENWLALQYKVEASEIIRSWMPSLQTDLTDFDSEVGNWVRLRFENLEFEEGDLEHPADLEIESQKLADLNSEIIDKIFIAKVSSLHRDESKQPDFGILEGGKQLVSFHPFVEPCRIFLHSLAVIWEGELIMDSKVPKEFGLKIDQGLKELLTRIPIKTIKERLEGKP